MKAPAAILLGLVLAVVPACRRKERDAPSPAEKAPPAAVPVRTARVAVATLERTVAAPGHTVALAQQKLRAPFAGTLLTLTVTDGDRVRRGEVVGTIVSRDSDAALSGAREMERAAKTDAEKADAVRALALAERDLVRTALRSPADGVVLSHGAASGDRVSEDQDLLTLAEAASIAFVADVAQSALREIRPGLTAAVELAGNARPAAGTVHDILPTANAADFTAPVRIDLTAPGVPLALGLFGNARIVVEQKKNAVVVPEAAVLRDDVTGKARVALVRDGRVHWQGVVTGLRGAAGTEVLSPALTPGDAVVVEGLVGLPESAAVAERP